jgi:hypothetical protein
MPDRPAYSTHQIECWIRYRARNRLRWFMSGMASTNQPSLNCVRSTAAAWMSCSASRTCVVAMNVLPLLNQSPVGRSCIHQCPEPQ